MAQGSPNFAINPNCGVGLVQVGDNNRLTPANPVTILTAGTNGSRLERILVEPIGPTKASVLRLWKYDGTNYHLWVELPVSQLTPAGGTQLTPATLEAVTAANLLPELLPPSWTIAASINDTQVAVEMNTQSIALPQTTAGAANLNLNGSGVTAAATAAIAALQAPTSGTALTLTSVPYVGSVPFVPTLTSAANLSAINFIFIGRDNQGNIVMDTVTGPNANTVSAPRAYAAVDAIVPNGTSASTVSVGTSAFAGSGVFAIPGQVMLFSSFNLSAINFTISGISSQGVYQTEVLAGPNGGHVQSVKNYLAIYSIASSAAVANVISVGNPPLLSGIKVHAVGGNF